MPLEAARASAEHLWRIGFPFHAPQTAPRVPADRTDVDWAAGEGADVRGPVAAILPLLAGRAATLPGLTGYGVPALTGRMVR